MISIITGKPGTGKTYNLARLAHKFIHEGKDVYSNFYINFDQYDQERQNTKFNRLRRFLKTLISKYLGIKLRENKIGKIYFWTKIEDFLNVRGGEILIDECQIYFNSRGWKNLPLPLQYKFQQHRKHIKRDENGNVISLNIWGAVQNVKRIDTVIRELVNDIYLMKKAGPLFISKQYDIDEIDKEKRECYGRTLFLYNSKLAKTYDTFEEIHGFTDTE